MNSKIFNNKSNVKLFLPIIPKEIFMNRYKIRIRNISRYYIIKKIIYNIKKPIIKCIYDIKLLY